MSVGCLVPPTLTPRAHGDIATCLHPQGAETEVRRSLGQVQEAMQRCAATVGTAQASGAPPPAQAAAPAPAGNPPAGNAAPACAPPPDGYAPPPYAPPAQAAASAPGDGRGWRCPPWRSYCWPWWHWPPPCAAGDRATCELLVLSAA